MPKGQGAKDTEKYKSNGSRNIFWISFIGIELIILFYWVLIPSLRDNPTAVEIILKALENIYKTDNKIYLLLFISITITPYIFINFIPKLFLNPYNKYDYLYHIFWIDSLLITTWALRPVIFIDTLKSKSIYKSKFLEDIFNFDNASNIPLYTMIAISFIYFITCMDFLNSKHLGSIYIKKCFWLIFTYSETLILWPINILGFPDNTDIRIDLGKGLENLRKPENSSSLMLALTVLIIVGTIILLYPKSISMPGLTSPKEHHYFLVRILTVGIMGGTLAILLPVAVKSATSGVGGLRNSILLATGGLIAIITLGETRRKNDQDHKHQIHTERRSRYSKAIKQIADDKLAIRMGGVYNLIGLADDWLADESPNSDEQHKEGQFIINNLCAYIRSPFILAERYKIIMDNYNKDSINDKTLLLEEKEIRLTILKEIKNRLNKGLWSNFEYNFSNAVFFYPVDFSGAIFKRTINLSQTIFYDNANFSGAKFYNTSDFSEITFYEIPKFEDSLDKARFSSRAKHNFTPKQSSPRHIQIDENTQIPEGAELFDPFYEEFEREENYMKEIN